MKKTYDVKVPGWFFVIAKTVSGASEATRQVAEDRRQAKAQQKLEEARQLVALAEKSK